MFDVAVKVMLPGAGVYKACSIAGVEGVHSMVIIHLCDQVHCMESITKCLAGLDKVCIAEAQGSCQ